MLEFVNLFKETGRWCTSEHRLPLSSYRKHWRLPPPVLLTKVMFWVLRHISIILRLVFCRVICFGLLSVSGLITHLLISCVITCSCPMCLTCVQFVSQPFCKYKPSHFRLLISLCSVIPAFLQASFIDLATCLPPAFVWLLSSPFLVPQSWTTLDFPSHPLHCTVFVCLLSSPPSGSCDMV